MTKLNSNGPNELHGLMTTTVLCDADGNLFPSEEPAFVASAKVTNRFLREYGIDLQLGSEQLRMKAIGKNFRTTMADLAAAYGISLSDAESEFWVGEELRAVIEYLALTLRPDPEVLIPVDRLSRRFTLAAVSSSATERLRVCFAATALSTLIPEQRWFSAEDSLLTPVSKPDPAVYLHACRELSIAPSQAIAVEDSVPGVESAVRAGILAIGNVQFVPSGESEQRVSALREAGAATVVRSWSELETRLLP